MQTVQVSIEEQKRKEGIAIELSKMKGWVYRVQGQQWRNCQQEGMYRPSEAEADEGNSAVISPERRKSLVRAIEMDKRTRSQPE